LKVTWLASTPAAPFTPVKCYHFDHIISKAVLDKDEDFKSYCTHKTEFEFDLLGDIEMKNLKRGEIIQISRRGYYIIDQECTVNQPLVLFNIPEGNKNESPTSYMSITNQKYATKIMEVATNKIEASKENNSSTQGKYNEIEAINLNKQVKDQGETVKNLKNKKAAKVKLKLDLIFRKRSKSI
jgi:bifunctional glutamyl/prolyl-tRNA synthetase